ncbi:hypothetical protein ABRP72_13145 [Pectobacterium carotovorum]|uniref:hypothetical protein n=1 Tax=Pectobacterium TaxID=122277 RepID=UPI001CC47D7A|nr:hypothetical protein [Pectobacterium polaris]UAY90412.1 hypothetical protein KSL88_12755 [Pectobacterium polaris]UAY91512.1 hypothetical protein KSL88_18805 [Pectobacterium polaris]
MPNQMPTITATLQVTPNFTGRVLVYVKDGQPVRDMPLSDDQIALTVDGFIELAKRAGWHVAPAGETK